MSTPAQGHRWYSHSSVRWLRYCLRCGLVPLRNEISELCARLGCSYTEHSTFQAWRRSNGGRHP